MITIGTLHAGTAPIVIPPSATVGGSVRTFDQGLRETLARRIEETVLGISRAMGGDARVDYKFGYPILVNDAAMSSLVETVGTSETRRSPAAISRHPPTWMPTEP